MKIFLMLVNIFVLVLGGMYLYYQYVWMRSIEKQIKTLEEVTSALSTGLIKYMDQVNRDLEKLEDRK